MDQRELAYKNSRAALLSARYRYDDMGKQLDFAAKQARKALSISKSVSEDYIVRSPAQGRIYRILREEGEMVSAQNPLALLGSATDFFLELQADEYDIVKLKPGQRVLVVLDSYRGQVFEAITDRIFPVMDERTDLSRPSLSSPTICSLPPAPIAS